MDNNSESYLNYFFFCDCDMVDDTDYMINSFTNILNYFNKVNN